MIRMEIPWLPPTVNHAYVNLKGGRGRMLSTEGKRYQANTTSHLLRTYPQELKMFTPNGAYGIAMAFFFPAVLNAGWPEKADSRYKRIDVSNRLKLLEDVLAKAAGIDDSQNMVVLMAKLQGPEKSIIWAWDIEVENMDGFAAELRSLQQNGALPTLR